MFTFDSVPEIKTQNADSLRQQRQHRHDTACIMRQWMMGRQMNKMDGLMMNGILNLLIQLLSLHFLFDRYPSLPSLFFSSSVRPSGGWLCPHALCLHAQQPAVPSTHGTISFLLPSLSLCEISCLCFLKPTFCDTYSSAAPNKLLTLASMLWWQCVHCLPQYYISAADSILDCAAYSSA